MMFLAYAGKVVSVPSLELYINTNNNEELPVPVIWVWMCADICVCTHDHLLKYATHISRRPLHAG